MEQYMLTATEAFVIAIGAMGMGMMLLIRGGNWTVDASIYLAKHLGVSRLLIGLTVIAFGTSLPELIVSINSNFRDLPGIALGNVIGSNIANILLVIGATAFVAQLTVQPKRVRRDLVIMVSVTAILAGLMILDWINHTAGFCLFALLVIYTLWEYRHSKIHGHEDEDHEDDPVFKNLKASAGFLLLGLAGIALGAEFLIRGATISAEVIGVPDAVIALSVIAIGTSLPELSTCIIAASKKQSDIVIGNIIGSNLFNILMIVGITAMLKPIDMSLAAPQLTELDIWITLAVSIIFSLILLFYKKINRMLGILFLGSYIIYMGVIFALYLT